MHVCFFFKFGFNSKLCFSNPPYPSTSIQKTCKTSYLFILVKSLLFKALKQNYFSNFAFDPFLSLFQFLIPLSIFSLPRTFSTLCVVCSSQYSLSLSFLSYPIMSFLFFSLLSLSCLLSSYFLFFFSLHCSFFSLVLFLSLLLFYRTKAETPARKAFCVPSIFCKTNKKKQGIVYYIT